jgi:regulator of replication initiation timing
MDFSSIDEVERKLGMLFERINTLKSENGGLRRDIYSLKTNLEQARASSAGGEDMKRKYSGLVEERDRLMMERELIRAKIKSALEKIDEIVSGEE